MQGSSDEFRRHLSIRGKNLHFLMEVINILDFDPKTMSHVTFKQRFTTENVRRIYEAILDYWPRDTRLEELLREDERQAISGLFTGMYNPDALTKSISRHAMYSERLILADPLPYPLSLRPEFSPLEHPDQYRTVTLRYIRLMLSLFEWIERDIVWIIRPPSDFSHEVKWNLLRAQEKFAATIPGFHELLEQQVAEIKESKSEKDFERFSLLLSLPDKELRGLLRKTSPNITQYQLDSTVRQVQKERDEHPYFIEPYGPDNPSEMHIMTTGMSYLESRLAASVLGSHLVTDMRTRWREIEFGREQAEIDDGRWSPLAKAISKLQIKTLDKADLEFALQLRKDGLLVEFRSFLRKLWTSIDPENEFDDRLAADLEANISEEVAKAREEWDMIGEKLLRQGGGYVLGAAGLVASGQVHLALAAVGKSAIEVGVALWDRSKFRYRHPAAIFLDLED